MSKNKSKPYIFVTQQKLIDFCRYDIGWFDLVGGDADDAYPSNGFDVQCEVDYPMQLEDLRTALTHFADDNVPLDDFIFDWWYPVVVYSTSSPRTHWCTTSCSPRLSWRKTRSPRTCR